MRVTRKLMCLTGMAVIAGCSDVTTPAQVETTTAAVSLTQHDYAREESALRVIASGLALALEKVEHRLAVRDAMRDSPWDVHQISLQAFLASDQGQGLLADAAKAAGETPDEFLHTLSSLPDLDFYVPSREHRRTWRGSGGIRILSSLNFEGGNVFGYGPGGVELRGDALERAHSEAPAMILHPAEPRGRRNNPQPAGVGEVIQSPDESERAVHYTWVDPDGTETVVDLEAVRTGTDPNFTFMTSSTGDTTYLDYIWFTFSDAGDDAEVMVKAKFYAPDGTLHGTAQWANYNLKWETHHYPGEALIARRVPDNSVAKINVEIHEDDCGCFGNGNDVYGNRDFTWSDRAQIRSIYGGGEQTNVELDWTPLPAPVLTTVRVGSVTVTEGESAFTTARGIDQYGYVMPGYSVSSWWTANTSIATVTASGSNGASVFGQSDGVTTQYATISGKTGSAAITVNASEECIEDPESHKPICPM